MSNSQRLFYTCPIRAAYMSKEFGVNFYLPVPENNNLIGASIGIVEWPQIILDSIERKNSPIGLPIIFFGEKKLFVAPESEHIFEPKEGDKGFKEGLGFFNCNHIGLWTPVSGGPAIESDDAQIVMRDGKHFFMPEIEINN